MPLSINYITPYDTNSFDLFMSVRSRFYNDLIQTHQKEAFVYGKRKLCQVSTDVQVYGADQHKNL
jgi:hypothetical protein